MALPERFFPNGFNNGGSSDFLNLKVRILPVTKLCQRPRGLLTPKSLKLKADNCYHRKPLRETIRKLPLAEK